MRFTIISSKAGQQPPQSSCDFYAPGGTIGRGTDNNLVLPDADRAISRLQAIVHVDAGGECRITNRGNVTKVVLNDIPLERGRQVELQDGDILTIDEYRIEVSDLVLDTQPVSRMAAAAQPVSRPCSNSGSVRRDADRRAVGDLGQPDAGVLHLRQHLHRPGGEAAARRGGTRSV